MHICDKRWCGACAGAVALALMAGCASPGPPLPPSLKLPAVVTDLAANRTGDAVTLRWTTPADTTDKLPIKGPIVAEICREMLAATLAPASGAKAAMTVPCAPVVGHASVVPGESELVDALPAALTSGPAQLLAYRVQLRNTAGHTAGPSAAVYAASGAAPEAIEGLQAKATKAGVVLEWRAEASVPEDAGVGAVELDRVWVDAPAERRQLTSSAASGNGAPKSDLGLGAPAKEPAESHLRVTAAEDAGGTIDRGAEMGRSYRYMAQRVRTLNVGGKMLEVHSMASASVTVAVRDIFPPETPAGLVAVPGFAGADDAARRPVIDLSWEPDSEPDLAGYRVYRRELDGTTPEVWRVLGPELVTVPAYRDLSVGSGQRYAYRVTAVSGAGNESGPSAEVVESAPVQ
jgi:hypothetical protein